MRESKESSFLFLLANSALETRRQAAKLLREVGMRVAAQFGNVAVEGLGTRSQAQKARESDLFAASFSGPVLKEHFERLDPDQRAIVEQWNTRFSSSYRELVKDQTHRGKSWGGHEDLGEPMPYTQIAPEDFLQRLETYERETGKSLTQYLNKRTTRFTPQEFVDYEKELGRLYDDPTLAYHLARTAYRLGPEYYELVARLPQDFVGILYDFFPEADCWRMDGEIAVGIVFVESSRADGPKFGTDERNEICQRVLDGHNWLVGLHPTGNLSWVYDFQFVTIDVPNGSGDPDEQYWRDPAMGQVRYDGASYSATWGGIADYRNDLRVTNGAAHALVIFITPYANSWYAYAGGGKITLANKDNWAGWGRGTLDAITAHETSHLFGSADEYTGSGTPCSSCDTKFGCDQLPNGNCGACAHPHRDCVMNQNSRRMCGYTRGHIGWGHLFLELTTSDDLWSGTDDDVSLDIGDRTFYVDTPDQNDFETGNRDGYPFYEPDLAADEIRRVLIRKGPDGFAGGWKLKRVRLWLHGDLVCDQDNINQWLEDEHRWWVGCIHDSSLVNSLSISVATGDVWWAGTDDDVTLTLAGRDWNLDNPGHDDFERGNTDNFDLDPQTGFRVAEIHSIRLHKSPDGVAGGWRLHGVRLTVNGADLYNNQGIDQWLEDDHRNWSDTF
jgi:hypothetical protein